MAVEGARGYACALFLRGCVARAVVASPFARAMPCAPVAFHFVSQWSSASSGGGVAEECTLAMAFASRDKVCSGLCCRDAFRGRRYDAPRGATTIVRVQCEFGAKGVSIKGKTNLAY